MTFGLAFLMAGLSAANAKCDSILNKVDKTPKSQIAELYTKLNKCDSGVAGDSFFRFMKRSNDTESLVSLSISAIRAGHWPQVGLMPTKIPEKTFDIREKVTEAIGKKCKQEPKVRDFLKASYHSNYITKPTAFSNWSKAYTACEDEQLEKWIFTTIEKPPQKLYDSKYNSLLEIGINRKKGKALEHLEKAAISAAEKGPYDEILSKMEDAVNRGFGKEVSKEDKIKHQKSLVNIAKNVGPEKAKAVASQLANAGAENKAAELLPTIYADRYKNNHFTYAAASIEKADCDGVKKAAIHVARVKEPGKRYTIDTDVESNLRAFSKAFGGGLFSKKCAPLEEPWPITINGEPILESNEVDKWLKDLKAQIESQGFKVQIKKESTITLK